MGSHNEHTGDGAIERQKLVRAGGLHWVHWLVVAFSFLITLGAWHVSNEQLTKRIEEKFQREADQAIEMVRERMMLYENALWGAVALHDASDSVTYPEWVTYANSLHIDTTYPGINGIGVILHLPSDDLTAFIAEQRRQRPDFNVHPEHSESEHWPITFIEPAETNRAAIGLDMAFERNRHKAIRRARDSGDAQVTGPISLVQDAKKTPGFLFYAPFYRGGAKPRTIDERRESIVGVTYAPFIMQKLMKGTLSRQNRQVHLAISDAGSVLYDDTQHGDSARQQPRFREKVSIGVYGRTWDFDITPNERFLTATSDNQPLVILAGGIAIDTLLFGLFVLLSRANRRALAYADAVTHELRIKTEYLELTNTELDQFAYVASHDLRSPLEGIKKLATWVSADNADQLPEKSVRHLEQMHRRITRSEHLLDDLLQYSRAGRKDYQSHPVDCGEMVRGITELASLPAGFTVDVDPAMPTLVTPKTPLEQVMRNLISNAIKHHDREDGTVTVSCRDRGAQVEFEVRDDGPGIDPRFHEQVFKMFETLRPRDELEGSGMGLAIVKKLVERYGGEITVESDRDRGTVFRFSWPTKWPEKS